MPIVDQCTCLGVEIFKNYSWDTNMNKAIEIHHDSQSEAQPPHAGFELL